MHLNIFEDIIADDLRIAKKKDSVLRRDALGERLVDLGVPLRAMKRPMLGPAPHQRNTQAPTALIPASNTPASSSAPASADNVNSALTSVSALERLRQRAVHFPVVPYRVRPRSPSPVRPVAKKQKASFSGSLMDNQDAQWYQDDDTVVDQALPAFLPHSIAAVAPIVPASSSHSFPSSSSRQLSRLDSEQAVSLFCQDDHSTNSG